LPNELNPEQITRLIVVDTNQWHRLDRMDKLRDRTDIKIDLWDHHMTGEGNIRADRSFREHVGATVTLFVRKMIAKNIKLSSLVSTVMLIGLYEDTGHLSFPSTTADDARAAAYLLENRADLNVAGFFLNPPYEETQKEILFEMMKETEKTTINGNSIGFNTVYLDKKVANLAAVVNMYRKIINVDAIFVTFVNNSTCTVIGRSGVATIDIGLIMSHFGGGGHSGAGSASVKNSLMSPLQIRENIVTHLAAEQTGSVTIADIMSFPVFSVAPDCPMVEVQKLMANKDIRGVIVAEDDEIKGIIVLWDLKKIKKERQWNSPAKAFMARNIVTISPSSSPAEAARTIINKDVGHLPVVLNGKMVGIVTRTDILTYFYDLMPD
ncbi:MAG: CBS domain-containing protein, partial [Deltaproteobacteria bacterium]|nr:CBS domain-containing protein [Deltaproteobacteria bacterium]